MHPLPVHVLFMLLVSVHNCFETLDLCRQGSDRKIQWGENAHLLVYVFDYWLILAKLFCLCGGRRWVGDLASGGAGAVIPGEKFYTQFCRVCLGMLELQ